LSIIIVQMIQRFQTVYLLFASLLSAILLKGSILNFISATGSKYFISFSGIWKSNENGMEHIERLFPLSVLLVIIPVIYIIALLFYKRRKLQIIITLTGAFLTGVLIVLVYIYSVTVIQQFDSGILPGIKMGLPLLTIILAILACRNIIKDEQLVRSYDRLR
jgi:hypothetical protein